MRQKYGLPYMGSKERIAKEIVDLLPAGKTFVDVFAGGCAVTGRALESGKWDNYIANDITGTPDFWLQCIHGHSPDPRWISREEFHEKKGSDFYVRLCWSFGNDGWSYAYGKKTEPLKKALHQAIVDCNFGPLKDMTGIDLSELAEYKSIHERRLKAKRMIRSHKPYTLTNLKKPENLESLENLERLKRLEDLERLENLETKAVDYRKLDIPPDAVVYCDPPYRNTIKYSHVAPFNHEDFYDWACSLPNPVFISEYVMPEDRFTKIWQKPVRSLRSPVDKSTIKYECLWVPKKRTGA